MNGCAALRTEYVPGIGTELGNSQEDFMYFSSLQAAGRTHAGNHTTLGTVTQN